MKSREVLLAWLPFGVGAICLVAFCCWFFAAPAPEPLRVPVEKKPAPGKALTQADAAETLVPGPGKPSALPGDWPQFRGPGRIGLAQSTRPIARAWPATGPKVLWRIPVGEGHAGATIHQGRVYLVDYDREKQRDAIRCLSLDDGREIWRYSYPVQVKRNHGMSRTIPCVNDRYVVAFGPKCHVHCLDALTGKLVWKKDLVRECGAKVPMWYAGQCPLLDGDRVILAPGAKPLMMAVDLATGRTLWQTKDHEGMGMTHSSIAPVTFKGQKQYVYCTDQGVVSVAADDGRVLWTKPDWKIGIATVPSPIQIGEDKIFFCGGYGAGSAMIRLSESGGAIKTEELFRRGPKIFGSVQHTPILYQDHLYGVIPGASDKGELVCMDLSGNQLWNGGALRFGIGPYLIVGDLLLALCDEDGTLHLAEASPAGYKELAKAKLLNGADAWGPMAFAEGRLILRDLTEMICVDLGA